MKNTHFLQSICLETCKICKFLLKTIQRIHKFYKIFTEFASFLRKFWEKVSATYHWKIYIAAAIEGTISIFLTLAFLNQIIWFY